jgi:hypothetical protein
VVTICTTSLTITTSAFCPHSVFMCFVWISEQTAIISPYSINWLAFITKTVCVYCAVRSEFYIYFRIIQALKGKDAQCDIIAGGATNQNWYGRLWRRDEPLKANWLLYVPPGLTFTNSTFCPHSVFVCFVWIWKQTAIISLYIIKLIGFYNRDGVCLLRGTIWIQNCNLG